MDVGRIKNEGHMDVTLIFFVLFLLILPHSSIADYPDGYYRVDRIIDGDTFVLTDGKRVRLLGIDAPEIGEHCGTQAMQKLASLILDQMVYLEKDVSETDQYDRLLRYVFIDGAFVHSMLFVNLILVEEGYAWAGSYSPDVKYASELADAEKSARNRNRGCLWNVFFDDDLRGYLEVGCFMRAICFEGFFDGSL
jgi:micrococcal nuclease